MSLLQARTTKLVLCGVTFFVACGFADTITVLNPSFEILPVNPLPISCGFPGCLFSVVAHNPIPDWNSTSIAAGQLQPGVQAPFFNTHFFNSVPDGITTAYADSGIISQEVSATVQNGLTYTLMVDIGFKKNSTFAGTADLRIGVGSGAEVIPATGTEPNPGDWSTYTAIFVGTTADAGKSITIELNNPLGVAQANFDDVRLTAVPEPAFFGVVGFGLAGLLAFARRKRRA